MSQYVSPLASVLLDEDELFLEEAFAVLTRFARLPSSESLATKPPSDWYSFERFLDLVDIFEVGGGKMKSGDGIWGISVLSISIPRVASYHVCLSYPITIRDQ